MFFPATVKNSREFTYTNKKTGVECVAYSVDVALTQQHETYSVFSRDDIAPGTFGYLVCLPDSFGKPRFTFETAPAVSASSALPFVA